MLVGVDTRAHVALVAILAVLLLAILWLVAFVWGGE